MSAAASDLWRLLTLQDANTRVVLAGTSLLGLASGVIGSFAVLRRRALLGDALAHATLPGICVAFLVIGDKSFAGLLAGALAFGALGVACVAFVRSHTRIKEDAAIGMVLSGFFGLGIVLSRIIQNQPGGNRAGLDAFLLGKAAAMVEQDVRLIAIAAAAVLLVSAALFKEFRLLCFDRPFAASQGWPVQALDLLLMGLICLCTVIGLPAVGVVLMAALLVIPASAARFWTERLLPMTLIAGLIGLLSGAGGTAASALYVKTPAGPLIVLLAAVCFAFSLLAAPRRGVVAGWLRRRRLRLRVGRQHVLRALYELVESAGAAAPACTLDRLLRVRSWSLRTLVRELREAERYGLVRSTSERFELTPAGRAEALRVVRAHRLWEMFLISHAAIAPDHVDRDADEIEHVLPPQLLAELEASLRTENRWPADLPDSPHTLSGVWQ